MECNNNKPPPKRQPFWCGDWMEVDCRTVSLGFFFLKIYIGNNTKVTIKTNPGTKFGYSDIKISSDAPNIINVMKLKYTQNRQPFFNLLGGVFDIVFDSVLKKSCFVLDGRL